MTTSYELSLRLKEAGAVQTNREYYWVKSHGGEIYRYAGNQLRYAGADGSILCAALTLGELVRELPELVSLIKLSDWFIIGGFGAMESGVPKTLKATSPEEAAGELLFELKNQKV